jgi:hypothetical protein
MYPINLRSKEIKMIKHGVKSRVPLEVVPEWGHPEEEVLCPQLPSWEGIPHEFP